MERIIIIRYCEIHLKGKNRNYFESLLEKNIRKSLSDTECTIERAQSRYLVKNFKEADYPSIKDKLGKVAGIHSLSLGYEVKTDEKEISDCAKFIMKDKQGTFKVETNRADKKYPKNSIEISRDIGGDILESNPMLTVNVTAPEHICNIDLREDGNTYLFADTVKGIGGMPVGSSGKGTIMISGGIDSPVAAFMMAKRGMKLVAVHFHSFPYTGEAAKQKVIDLTKIVSGYAGEIDLHVVPFTHIQEAIHEKCPEEMMITLMRRFMFRIAERISEKVGSQALITGESLGQVASQTIESITTSNAVVKMPVLRPLIGFDKLEIIEISRKIGTYETSILPYEDCCTVFLPKYPLIRPKPERVIEAESKLDVEPLIEEALKNVQVIKLG
ncbi:MAG: tRNA 4-thiouridine(8) synthase ThiI [Christensenellaceae bacterium]|nr:tRNA 4-thiouridine(8) synthase ThiI [Christensenellaceae bacterium]